MSSIRYIDFLINEGYTWAQETEDSPQGSEDHRDEKEVCFEDLEPELWTRMPDEILEKIFARLPLKTLKQVRLLSKSWLEKVSSSSFQNEVCQQSRNWRSYCPLHYSDNSLRVRGFDPSTREWKDMLSLSYLPEFVRKDCVLKFRPIAHNDTRRSFQGVAGALLCFLQLETDHSNRLIIHITNPLNKSLRKLPPIVTVHHYLLFSVKVIPQGWDAYRVLVLEMDAMRLRRDTKTFPIRAHVYDSRARSWASKRVFQSLPSRWCCRSIEYYQGSIYLLYQTCSQSQGGAENRESSEDVLSLGVYDLEAQEWKELGVTVQHPYSFSNCSLCVCGSSLLMVTIGEFVLPQIEFDGKKVSLGSIRKNAIRIFMFDPELQLFTEISRGPAEDIEKEYLSGKFYHDEESIYFSALRNATVISYNVCRQVWLTQPLLGTERSKYNTYYGFLQHAYQPGLNPFILA